MGFGQAARACKKYCQYFYGKAPFGIHLAGKVTGNIKKPVKNFLDNPPFGTQFAGIVIEHPEKCRQQILRGTQFARVRLTRYHVRAHDPYLLAQQMLMHNARIAVSQKSVTERSVRNMMKKFVVFALAAVVLVGTATVSRAAILFDYEVKVDSFGPFIPVDYFQSSGAAGKLTVEGVAGSNFDASGTGTDVDIATVLASQTPPSTSFSNFDGSTSSYTFSIIVTDLASSTSGTFTVSGFLSGRFRELPGFSYTIGNTYTLPPGGAGSGPIQIGSFFYSLDFPVFGQDFDSPAPDGRWTFNIRAVVPEPGALAMLVGAAVCGSMFIPYRLRRNRRS